MGLASVLILALDASSPHLCAAAHASSTQLSLPAEETREVHYPALAAGVLQQAAPQAPQAPGMCILYAAQTSCPADFPQPTPTVNPTPNTTPPPSAAPATALSPSPSPSPDPSPSVTLASQPEPTHKHDICT